MEGAFDNGVVAVSSVAPTAVTYGDEPGKAGRRCLMVHSGSVRPFAPESPEAENKVTPRS
jgi:hypothetical protein